MSLTSPELNLPDFKLTMRVNNQITITRQRLAAKNTPFYRSASDSTPRGVSPEVLKRISAERNGMDGYYDDRLRRYILLPPDAAKAVSQQERLRSLDLIKQFQHKKSHAHENPDSPKRGYGAPPNYRGFSYRSGQKIRESGAAIDILCKGDPSHCRVITLTLPSSEIAAFKALSDWSAYCTNRITQIIRRREEDGFYWFYCIEHQKRGALHWHICLFHEDKELSRTLADSIVSKWRDVLSDISSISGVDMLFSKGFKRRCALSEMQSINQEMYAGCGAYFSKYASKGARDAGNIHGQRELERLRRAYPVSSYWGRSQNLARLCEENSFSFKFQGQGNIESQSLRDDVMDILIDRNISKTDSFSFKKEVEFECGKLTICEGLSEVFYLSPSDYQEVLALCRARFGKAPSSSIPYRAKRSWHSDGYDREIGYF